MKELSIQEKAKAYDEAFRIAQELYNDPNSSKVGKGYVCTVFSELKENEDERIRKGIESIIKHYRDNGETICPYPFVTIEEALAWLERQGSQILANSAKTCKDEQKPIKASYTTIAETGDGGINALVTKELPTNGCDELFPELKESEDERVRTELINGFKECLKNSQYPKNAQKYWHNIKIEDILAWLEKQGENHIVGNNEMVKSADKVEPKFHEGDWIVANYGKVNQIVSVYKDGDGYILDDGTYIKDSWREMYHLWSINDAKDGDVLAENKDDIILIFRGIGNAEWNDVIDYYCRYDCYREEFIVQEDLEFWGYVKDNQLKPATKEQRGLLFSKMKDAGYEWDSEKKELKLLITNGGDFFESENCEQKPTWSEEDEEIYQSIIDDTVQENQLDNKQINWLKSLKSQKLCVYNPYKAVVESIAKMCDKYKNYMGDEKEAKDFLANVAVKCHEAAEYDKNYPQ